MFYSEKRLFFKNDCSVDFLGKYNYLFVLIFRKRMEQMMPIVSVSKPLREKLGDDGVDSLIDLLKESQQEQKNNNLEFVEEKFERRLTTEMGKLENKISETKIEVQALKAELIKWMFIFWVGQVSVILGILFTFFK